MTDSPTAGVREARQVRNLAGKTTRCRIYYELESTEAQVGLIFMENAAREAQCHTSGVYQPDDLPGGNVGCVLVLETRFLFTKLPQ